MNCQYSMKMLKNESETVYNCVKDFSENDIDIIKKFLMSDSNPNQNHKTHLKGQCHLVTVNIDNWNTSNCPFFDKKEN